MFDGSDNRYKNQLMYKGYEAMNNISLTLGIIGGLGLGLLVGSEFNGRMTTLLGASLVIIMLISSVILVLKDKKSTK